MRYQLPLVLKVGPYLVIQPCLVRREASHFLFCCVVRAAVGEDNRILRSYRNDVTDHLKPNNVRQQVALHYIARTDIVVSTYNSSAKSWPTRITESSAFAIA